MQDIGGKSLSSCIPLNGYSVDEFMPIALKIGTL